MKSEPNDRRKMRLLLAIFLLTVISGRTRAQGLAAGIAPPSETTRAAEATAAPSAPSARGAALQAALEKAEQLYRAGKLDEAAQAYEALIKAEPGSALAYARVVHVYLKQKKVDAAATAAAKAVELGPTLDAAHAALGEVYFRQGKMAETEHKFAALVKAGTKEPRAHLGLALLYKSASFYEHWKIAIDAAHALDPADPDIQREWIGTLSLRERVKAMQTYLAGETSDDAEHRLDFERELKVLQDEAQQRRPCRLATKITTMEAKLAPLLSGPRVLRAYGLTVQVNGVSSHLLLDTGAGGILINRKIAEKAGVKPVVSADIRGIGDKGSGGGYVGYAESIKIGALEFTDCYVEVLDKTSVIGDDGLIGSDVFDDFLVDINLPDGKLKLSPLPPRPGETAGAVAEPDPAAAPKFHDRYVAPTMKEFTPVFRFGHALLVQTWVNKLPPKLFLVDTGGFGNMISPAAAREVTKVSSDSEITLKGLSGKVDKVFRADELMLTFANLQQKNQDIVAFDLTKLSDSFGTEISGILGFSMLWLLDIQIDYRDGLILFKYDRNRAR